MESVLEEHRSRVLLPRCGRYLEAFVRLCECDRPRSTDVSLMITGQNTSRLPNRPTWQTPVDRIRPLDVDYSEEDLQLRSSQSQPRLRHMSVGKPATSEPRLGEMKKPGMRREKANVVTDTRLVSASRIGKAAPTTDVYKGSSATGPNLARRPVKLMRAQSISKPLDQLSFLYESNLSRKTSMRDLRLMPLDGSQGS